MKTRPIGPWSVSAIGLGCMSLSHAYGTPPPPEAAEKLLLRALDLGVTLFDTAILYGFGANEELVGRVLGPHRSRFVLASKGGMSGVNGKRVIDNRPETLRRSCEESLRRLRTDVIDLYYLHRWEKKVPIEDSIGVLAQLVREGKVRELGLSEVSAETLRRAHAVHPIVALQSEYSLWTRNPEIAGLAACRSLGTTFVAFSPLARGFLTGALSDPAAPGRFDAKDVRRTMPRFWDEHFTANLRLLDPYAALAREAGCTMAQLALAWMMARSEQVVPLIGTNRIDHLEEDLHAANVTLSADLLARLEALINQDTVSGPRYSEAVQAESDTEEF